MQVEHLTANHRKEWNSFAAQEPYFALLQTWEWGEFKERLGWKVYRIAIREQGRIIAGAQMLIRSLLSELASVAYIPRGPIGNWLEAPIASQLLSELHRVARRHRAIFLKIEPPLINDPAIDQTLQRHQFHPSPYTNQPRASLILDLQPSLDDILRKMRRRTRDLIRISAQKGVVIRIGSGDDLASFFKLMKITSQREHFPSRTRAYYEQEWLSFTGNKHNILLLATYQDQLLAAHIAYYFGAHAASFHGCSIIDHEKLHPNYLLYWEAIKWAKEQGCRSYDLWGIPDEVGQASSNGAGVPISDRTDGLWGVYRFKSGFSKNIAYFIGAYDYLYSPLLYSLVTNRLFNLGAEDRFSVMIDSLAPLKLSMSS